MKPFGLAAKALIAIILGIIAGIVFGPLCSVVKPVGDIFVMLLQMVVLPYISLSLIHGLGSLTPEIAKNLLKRGGGALLTLWGLVFVLLSLLSFVIPKARFLIIEEDPSQQSFASHFLSYLIPENPFYDLVNNIVPAVALFGLIIGVAVMHLKQKEPLLSVIERGSKALENIFLWLAHVAPIGIFAHIAYATGTVNFADLAKLEFYVIAYILACLFITFVILPILINNLTNLKFKEILRYFRRATFFAFATGVSSIAFPFIFGVVKKLAEKNNLEQEKYHSTSQTIIPLGYSFAQVGNCFILFFIFFLSFYFRHPFTLTEKSLIYFFTIPLSFGATPAPVSGISFLVNALKFPKQAMDLFNETFAITIHFEVLLSVASVLTFIIIALFSYYGLLQIRWKRLFTQLALALICFAGAVFLVKSTVKLTDQYEHLYTRLTLKDVIQDPVKVEIITDPEDWTAFKRENPIPEVPEYPYQAQILADFLKRGVVRVGYDVKNIPYCYLNENGEVVGYDTAYAYQLARDLDCRLQLVPVDISELSTQLNLRYYDIAMCAIIMNESRLREVEFSTTYADQVNVLVVPIAKKNQFLDLGKVRNTPLLITADGAYKEIIPRHFPKATLVPFAGFDKFEAGNADALLWSKLDAVIWCLDHPEYVVIDYGDRIGRRYFAYPIKNGALPFLQFLNSWLYLKQEQGFQDQMTKYWIDGITPKSQQPRWSVIRDVLHWVH
jgi:proton glutamate symport protein